MPQQITTAVENNFTKGLITEGSGLNFPENATTDTDNCIYTLIGEVMRRMGIDQEENGLAQAIALSAGRAISTYKWNNSGGTGSNQVLVLQIGSILSFFSITDSTKDSPLSNHLYDSSIDLSTYAAAGSVYNQADENTYADGNGYLFVFNAGCDPVYITNNNGTFSASPIFVQVRDFNGIFEPNVQVSDRPTTLTASHKYNLANQGWTANSAWGAFTNGDYYISGTGTYIFNVGTVGGITLGDSVYGYSQVVYYPGTNIVQYGSGTQTFSGTVTAYSAPNLTVNISSISNPSQPSNLVFSLTQTNAGFVDQWHTAEGNYPSNADVWWYFKTPAGVFDPASTQPYVTLATGNAPQGHYIISAFNQDRSAVSGIGTLTPIKTLQRPSNGCWFQGRVWYTGLNDSQQATGNASFYSWSENIYFSQVNVGTAVNFGNCFQVNDPTSENLFDLLPTDGGIIQIQGSGKIFRLFPIQNGLLVFAANGVWFITGSQGIGFAANDYTVTKISNIESLSSYTFVDVLGLPYFWNEEGIYAVQTQQGGGLSVEPLTVSTILSFYNDIPKQSKKYARGAYNAVDYVVQWIYKSEEETSVSDRYSFDRMLNFNTYNKAFYPYSIDNSDAAIHSIVYIQGPGGSESPDATFKYLFSYTRVAELFSFADEHDADYLDWGTITEKDFLSYFITGYKLRGQAIRKFQPQYVQMWSHVSQPAGYKIKGIWDYALDSATGRHSQEQTVEINDTMYSTMHKRHKIRGRGYALQFKVSSVTGKPFNIAGWAVVDTVNQGT